MKVAIVHYHLEPGGVTRVIENTVQSWEDSDNQPADWVIISGRPYLGEVLNKVKVIEGLDYASSQEAVDPKLLCQRLEDAAIQVLGALPDIWHVHNHSLGKNPSLTLAVAELARKGAQMLLQPHDFAEDGRAENFLNLGRSYKYAYPNGDQIHYATLNQRDQSFLNSAFKDYPSVIHLLPNSVPYASSKNKLADLRSSHHNLPDDLFLYPVRSVRRKNLGELALLSASHHEKHFANSLGPTNPSFQKTYQKWGIFGKSLNLSLTYGLGERTNATFPELVEHASSIINVSIAEGFGLGFLEPWMFGKSLCGRNIPEITSDFTKAGVNLDNLYSKLWIDLGLIDQDFLRDQIAKALSSNYGKYQVDMPEDCLNRAYSSMCSGNRIDFGRIQEDIQMDIIRKVHKSQYLQSTIKEQSNLEVVKPKVISKNRDSITQNFSQNSYGHRVLKIYSDVIKSPKTKCDFAPGARLLDKFLSPERLNLLRS